MEYELNHIRELKCEINKCKFNFEEKEHEHQNSLNITEVEINELYEDAQRSFKESILYTEEQALELNRILVQSRRQIKEKREEAELNIKEEGFISNVIKIYNNEVLETENQYLQESKLISDLYELRESLEELNKWYRKFITESKNRNTLNRLIVMENILDSIHKQFKLNIKKYRPVKDITLRR